jgi:putative membrane protein
LLLAATVPVLAWSGWSPVDRGDWLLENVLVAIALPLFVFGYRRLRFSTLSYAALFVFFCLHEVGAHYTYSMVPLPRWLVPDGGRNHYDRMTHFAYGFFVMPAVFDLFARRAALRGIWRWIVPVTFVMAHSMVYELVEWAAASVFGGDLGQTYLGTQGDEWDAQKDMFLATVGSIAATCLLAAARWPGLRAAAFEPSER